MDRHARVQFQVVRINRWSLAVVLLLALAMVFFPLSKLIPASSIWSSRVQTGVILLGMDLSGRSESQVISLLQRLAPRFHGSPVDARSTRQNSFHVSMAIPELNGYQLDVKATALRVMTAQPGTVVGPAVISVPALKTLAATFPSQPIYQGNPAKKQVSLIVNVAWGEEYLPDMLSTLDRHGVKTTFFITGKWAEKHADLVRTLAGAGHELATHGYTDQTGPFELIHKNALKRDIQQGAEVLYRLTGHKVLYYSPHMGEVNDQVVKAAADLGLKTIMWSLDTIDWKDPSADSIVQTVSTRAKPGDLILMHPRKNTAQALDRLVTELKLRSLQPVPVSNLLSSDPALPSSVPVDVMAPLGA